MNCLAESKRRITKAKLKIPLKESDIFNLQREKDKIEITMKNKRKKRNSDCVLLTDAGCVTSV